MKKKGGRGGVGGGRRAGRRLGRGVGIDWGRAGPPVRQTALVRTKHGFEKSRSTPRKKTAMLNFAFAYSPSSARRRFFEMALPLLMAETVRFKFHAIKALSIFESRNVKSCASSACVHAWPSFTSPSP